MSTYILTMRRNSRGPAKEDRALENIVLDRRRAMDRFLSGVEKRAYRIAVIAVRDADDALDIVQDAMIRLVRSYARRAEAEWTPLFYRILQNRIRDHQRHQSVRRRVLAWFSSDTGDGTDDFDPVAQAPDPGAVQPDHQLVLDAAMLALERAIQELPTRQQQAFLLRTVECLNVAATAKAMGCSDGSVKTHYSRAVHSLRATVGEYWEGSDHDE
jgi:RNA polymerase sigma-70 factor (ECF subfamily)